MKFHLFCLLVVQALCADSYSFLQEQPSKYSGELQRALKDLDCTDQGSDAPPESEIHRGTEFLAGRFRCEDCESECGKNSKVKVRFIFGSKPIRNFYTCCEYNDEDRNKVRETCWPHDVECLYESKVAVRTFTCHLVIWTPVGILIVIFACFMGQQKEAQRARAYQERMAREREARLKKETEQNQGEEERYEKFVKEKEAAKLKEEAEQNERNIEQQQHIEMKNAAVDQDQYFKQATVQPQDFKKEDKLISADSDKVVSSKAVDIEITKS